MNNTKIEEFFNGFKLGELIHRNELAKEKEEKKALCAIITVVAIVAVIVIAVNKYFKRRPIEEFEYDFDDDFDDTFSMDEFEDDIEDSVAIIEE